MVAKGESKLIYPAVVVKAGGVMCRALLDTGAGSSYASADLDCLNSKPERREFRNIEMRMQTSNKIIAIHKVQVTDVNGTFLRNTEVTRVQRSNLLSLPNPRYEETIFFI